MLAKVTEIGFTVKHEFSLRLRLVGSGEELVVTTKDGDEEGKEGVEETIFLQNGTADGNLLGITICEKENDIRKWTR